VKNLAVARRYAKALLLIGSEDGQAVAYKAELDCIASIMTPEKKLEQAICNPLYDMQARKKVLQAVINKLNLSKIMQSFLLLLFEKGRIGFVTYINNFYQKFADELNGIVRASLVSATELSSETIENIRTSLSKKTGKEITLEIEQDASLIGGIVTKIGDIVLDGSIKTQLLNMRESLKRGESV
jgi:F-type H+-transporting ATPase subunit delta